MEAFIYDAVRTPRGKGRPDGALHEITALSLAAQALAAVRDRIMLDTTLVDDVILGCVMPVGEQDSDIARVAAVAAGYACEVPGLQINRFCASGLEACNVAAAKVVSGEARFAIGGGVESMSRVPLAADGGAMLVDPAFAFDHYYAPQEIGADLIATLHGYSREDVDRYAAESQRRAALAWREGRFGRSIIPVLDQAGVVRLERDEHMRPGTTIESLGGLKPAFEKLGKAGYDAVAKRRYPQVPAGRRGSTCSSWRELVGRGRRRIGSSDRDEGGRRGCRPEASCAYLGRGIDRIRTHHHAYRSRSGDREASGATWDDNLRHRPVRAQ